MSFLQLLCEICPVVETILQNIRCFIVYIVMIVLDSFRKQCSVFFLSPWNMRFERLNNLPCNAVKPKFVAIFVFFVIPDIFNRNVFLSSDRGETGILFLFGCSEVNNKGE